MSIILIFAVCAFLVFSAIHYFGKIKKPCKRAFVSVLFGPMVLVAVNVLSSITGVLIPLSQLSVITSIALGVPGVTLLIALSVLV
ncbi:MAG: pro-sigmaK processing inhibitor BofA family protein [Ruminococcus sp.]|nr:pro-sigmaK processing inhibitor BofA family protein [Ruminococcus sp.]MBQ7134618.1 pro-sigmaK processing inhibitor BofA family protein [Ruminococcus sp.]